MKKEILKATKGKKTKAGIWGVTLVLILESLGLFEVGGLLESVNSDALYYAFGGLTAHGGVDKFVKWTRGEPQE